MDYIDKERFAYEDSLKPNTDKVWMVIFDKGEDVIEYENYYDALKQYNEEILFFDSVTTCEYSVIELGWIYSTEICSDYYKYFNVIERYE